jgi:hypothetical protein
MAAVFLIVALFANSGKAGFGAYSLSVVQKKVIEQGEFDYVDVPTTFGQLVERSSLIVRVRVSAVAEKGYRITGAHSPAVRTDVLGVVLEVFKADDRTSEPNQVIHILHPTVANGVDVGDTIVKQKGFKAFQNGREYLLFLQWNPRFDGYDIRWGPTGSYMIASGRIQSFNMSSAVSRTWNGQPAAEMFSAIRQAVIQ